MTRTEVLEIMTILKVAYPNYYSKMKAKEAEVTVALWGRAFAEDDAEIVKYAVEELILTHSGFPPDIAAVKEQVKMVIAAATGEPTDNDLWNMYREAASNCLYSEKQTFDRLPPVLQKFAGSPRGLYEHALMEANVFDSVTRGQFFKQITQIRQREDYEKRIPPQLKATIQNVVGAFEMPDEPRYLTPSEENDRRNELRAQIETVV